MVEIRVLTCKARNCEPLIEGLKKANFTVRSFRDESDYYKLPKRNPDRLMGSVENFMKLISDEELPEDNHDFIVMVEDDIEIADGLPQALPEILKNIPEKTIVYGFAMRGKYVLQDSFMEDWEAKGKPHVFKDKSPFTTQITIIPKKFHRLIENEQKYVDGGVLRRMGKVKPYDILLRDIEDMFGFSRMVIMPNLCEHLSSSDGVINSTPNRTSLYYDKGYDFSDIDWGKEFNENL